MRHAMDVFLSNGLLMLMPEQIFQQDFDAVGHFIDRNSLLLGKSGQVKYPEAGATQVNNL